MKIHSDELKDSSHFYLAINNKFANLMIGNQLSRGQLLNYFKQDYYFVEEDRKIIESLIHLSKDNKEKEMLIWFLNLLDTDEIPYIKQVLFDNNVHIEEIEMFQSTNKYIKFIENIIKSSNYLEIITIFYAGETLYFETYSNKKTDNYYIQQWENLHSDDLGKLVNFLKAIIDEAKITDVIRKVFNTTIDLEISFYQQFI